MKPLTIEGCARRLRRELPTNTTQYEISNRAAAELLNHAAAIREAVTAGALTAVRSSRLQREARLKLAEARDAELAAYLELRRRFDQAPDRERGTQILVGRTTTANLEP